MPKASKKIAAFRTSAASPRDRSLAACWMRANRALVGYSENEAKRAAAAEMRTDQLVGDICDLEQEAAVTPVEDMAGVEMRLRIAERRFAEVWEASPDPYDHHSEITLNLIRAALSFFGPSRSPSAFAAGIGAPASSAVG